MIVPDMPADIAANKAAMVEEWFSSCLKYCDELLYLISCRTVNIFLRTKQCSISETLGAFLIRRCPKLKFLPPLKSLK